MAEISDYLKELEEQKVQEESEIIVVRNPVVEELFKKYELSVIKYFEHFRKNRLLTNDAIYDSFCKSLRRLCCSSDDIAKFSLGLKKYDSSVLLFASGLFLSVLINTSSEKSFEIITSHLNTKIICVGYKNEKNVVVVGDLGDLTGSKQIDGTLRVKGCVDGYVGENMRNGQIIVEKNCTGSVGSELEGGEIFINGNVKGAIGSGSKGGKIYVEGKLDDQYFLPSHCKAQIYHKGVLVWPE